MYHCSMKEMQVLIALLLLTLIGGCGGKMKAEESEQTIARERQLVLPEIPVMVRSEEERRLYRWITTGIEWTSASRG